MSGKRSREIRNQISDLNLAGNKKDLRWFYRMAKKCYTRGRRSN